MNCEPSTELGITPGTTLLGLWAHPDDETYMSGGLMARVVNNGGQACNLSATDGEYGFPQDDNRSLGQRSQLRRRELATAMAHLGVNDIRHLGLPDGGLADVEPARLIQPLINAIEDVQPDLIVTFDSFGGTGHPDHIAISRAATAAWQATGIGRLAYSCHTPTWYNDFRPLHDAIEMWMGPEPAGTPVDELALMARLTAGEIEQKRAALAGHSSQTTAVAELMGETRYRQWWSTECFRNPTPIELAEAITYGATPVGASAAGVPQVG